MLANVETGVITEIFKTGEKNQTPSITRLPHNEFLLAKDEISIFVGLDSKPTRKYGLRWNQQPVNLEMIEPYCLAITPQSVNHSFFLVLSDYHTTVSRLALSLSLTDHHSSKGARLGSHAWLFFYHCSLLSSVHAFVRHASTASSHFCHSDRKIPPWCTRHARA
jgi:hypothetical protein